MAYILEFPITLKDAVTGAERPPTSEEIDFGIDDAEGIAPNLFSLTEYPRDKGMEDGTAIWFSNGSIFVGKLYPGDCPSWVPLCSPTDKVIPDTGYRGNVKWRADREYSADFNFYLNVDGSIS